MTAQQIRPTRTATKLAPSRVSTHDTLRTGVRSLVARRLRTFLSAMGIAIGIASLVAVLGLSASNRAQLLSELDTLGTNLLSARGGLDISGGQTGLPLDSQARISRVGGVESSASTRRVREPVRRTPETSRGAATGVRVFATQPNLADVVGAQMRTGRFFDSSTGAYDTVVLGSVAAERLGIDRAGVRIDIGERWMTVLGILEPATLADDLDSAVLIGESAAERYFDAALEVAADGTVTGDTRSVDVVYLRAEPASLDDVRGVIGSTLRPTTPQLVAIDRPSDALEAGALAESAFNSLFLGLGVIVLIVGAIGVANVMVITVIERRGEIGLRRSLGATRRHIRRQFIAESLLLSALGGLTGVLLGAAVTAGWASKQGWLVRVPPIAVVGGLAASLLIGVLAGVYPAAKAARLSPVDALRS